MKRKTFLRTGLLGLAGLKLAENAAQAGDVNQLVGFEHIPQTQKNMEKHVLHKSSTRGRANLGWLDSRHTFSFSNYYNPERVHFGVLRVLNDDIVEGGKGFGTHPHDNMEIISIPLKGDLEHKDSMGNVAVIKQHDVQIMSAGSGITHSEYNKNTSDPVNFLQIWVFPKERNITPRYDQKSFKPEGRHNRFQTVVTPEKNAEGVWINQDAWFSLGNFDAGKQTHYALHREGNGVYAFVLKGELSINGISLETRDGLGIWDTKALDIQFSTDAEVLLMEVPMQMN